MVFFFFSFFLRNLACLTYRRSSRQEGNEGCLDDVLVDTDAPNLVRAGGALDKGGGLDIATAANGVFLVVVDVEVDAEGLESVGER